MAEYIKREAFAEDIRESYYKLQEIYETLRYERERDICNGELGTFCEILLRLKDFPAADVVPVVRCKDCTYMEDAYVCNGFLICPASNMEITDNDFCSYGARKDGEG